MDEEQVILVGNNKTWRQGTLLPPIGGGTPPPPGNGAIHNYIPPIQSPTFISPNIYGLHTTIGSLVKTEYDLSKNNGLRWPFECWGDDGTIYEHIANWSLFKERIERDGEYKHNWLHRRLFMTLFGPQDRIYSKNRIVLQTVEDDWSVVYEPYPAHVRTRNDPRGERPSWHIWVEDRHPKPTYGETVVIMSTENSILHPDATVVALFKGQYYRVVDLESYGLGPHPPSEEEKKRLGDPKKRSRYRSIDDD